MHLVYFAQVLSPSSPPFAFSHRNRYLSISQIVTPTTTIAKTTATVYKSNLFVHASWLAAVTSSKQPFFGLGPSVRVEILFGFV